ncbi:MAG: alcohol dehydrogenase catalytic domain-containing protein [Candidatus Zeuxoniibacter abyssi]|nr:MAG: alcohol dehydrogenase catalytic domain-containing protein [Candidatus Persebacteraceae bacterium AB1(2)]
MKALVFTAPKTLRIQNVPAPKITDTDDVIVTVEACGICGSDMHAYQGHDERRYPPLILGHEAVGVISEGADVGQRVAINPLSTCGVCDDCVEGRENFCAHRRLLSIQPEQGAFAQLVKTSHTNLLRVPAEFSSEKAALAEPLACGYHAVSLAEKASRQPIATTNIIVIGGGAIGLACALHLQARGGDKIFIAETNAARRRKLKKYFDTYDPTGKGAKPPSGSVHIVMDAVGNAKSQITATDKVRRGGVIVHIGLGNGDGGIDARKLTLKAVTFVSSYCYSRGDFRKNFQLMLAGKLGDLDWYETRELKGGISTFPALINGKVSAAKIILRP